MRANAESPQPGCAIPSTADIPAIFKSDLLDILRSDVVEAAKRLLGATLVSGDLRAEIVETEAYRAEDDPASHAYRGPTRRNQIMFEEPGHAYVYFNYGCHWMLNVTAHEPGRAAGVLVRAARPISGLETMRERRQKSAKPIKDRNLLSGPGKLAQGFAIDGKLNGISLLDPKSVLRIEPAEDVRPFVAGPRVGIAVGKAEHLPWRFIDRENIEWASFPRPPL